METSAANWSFLEKLVFRFVFVLLILFIFIFNNGTFPWVFLVMKYPIEMLHVFIPWVAKSYLSLANEITIFTNGSGDTTYDYLTLAFIGLVSVPLTVIWTIADRSRANYNRLYYWLTVGVRFYVGLMLLNYGFVKVVQLQFPSPGVSRLMQTYGESSPMGLAWTFLGFSKGYNLFMGVAELMAGLLLFRRTVTVGAIISLMTTANVMAVNYFYDVPVKIVSTALVVMCLFLLVPNISRLFKFFFKGEAVKLRTLNAPAIAKKWIFYTKYIFKYLCICLVVLGGLITIFSGRNFRNTGPKSALHGGYDVISFVKNGDTLPHSSTETTRWKAFILDTDKNGVVEYMGNKKEYIETKTDTAAKNITIAFSYDLKTAYKLIYNKPDSSRLRLQGNLFGDAVTIELTKRKFLLTNRGFHWINEHPFNR